MTKKLFAAFAATSLITLSACDNTANDTATPPVDTPTDVVPDETGATMTDDGTGTGTMGTPGTTGTNSNSMNGTADTAPSQGTGATPGSGPTTDTGTSSTVVSDKGTTTTTTTTTEPKK